ncbi:BTB/POZ domain-containing protein 9-like [Galendromus occidentalis]|uniref:BTB/POZ domain-containing protein 9-like n=1 Tax=Galendromus occidentalis TaxID=34638 RepID=A0AAJ7WJB2_9ACAR|nr:BTB/POZ domain-containing protein 9-like [Galendromus occidentalis]
MEHTCDLATQIGSALFSEKFSDVTFIVEGVSLPAHKIILATSCEYFRALLCGEMKESRQSEITLRSVPLGAFKILMKFIYTAQIDFSGLDDDLLLELLELAHLYGFGKLQDSLCGHLETVLSIENVCVFFEAAHELQLPALEKVCCGIMDQVPDAVLKSESFYNLSVASVSKIISRDTFCAEEIEIFKSVQRWLESNSHREDPSKASLLEAVRLPLIGLGDLATIVRDSGLIPADLLMDAIRERENPIHNNSFFRGVVAKEANLATPEQGATKLKLKNDGSNETNSDNDVPAAPPKYESGPMPRYGSDLRIDPVCGLVVGLRTVFIISNIKFELPAGASHSYYVEVSVNLVDWVRLIDHSKYPCRSFQNLYFEPRALRYIRVMPAKESVNGDMFVTGFGASYIEEDIQFHQGLVEPAKNVASVELGAKVIEGGGGEDGMLGGTEDSTFASAGWTYGRFITIQLPQPYAVNSIRMKLPEDKEYCYYIETSLDLDNWTRVVDRTGELCCSWQVFSFQTLPVIFIRIVTTFTVDHLGLFCKNFECRGRRGRSVPAGERR